MTTIADLPLGAKVKLGRYNDSQIQHLLISKTHWSQDSGYPVLSALLITDKVIANRCFDYKELSNPIIGCKQGNPDYSVSNINQWLNSDAASGFWYSAQHEYDVPPSSYEDDCGFLNEWTNAEKNLLLNANLSYTVSDQIGSNPTTYEKKEVSSKVFLLASNELGSNLNQDKDEKPIAYFTDDSSRIAMRAGTNEITTWILRDGNFYNNKDNSSVGAVLTTGFVSGGNASPDNDTAGIRPACNIPLTTEVSSTIDEDGCYTLILPEPTAPPTPDDPQEPEVIVDGDTVDLKGLTRSNIGIIKRLTGSILTAAKSLFALKDHAHTFDDIDGVLPVSKGGTGGTSGVEIADGSITKEMLSAALQTELSGAFSLGNLKIAYGSNNGPTIDLKTRGFTNPYNAAVVVTPGESGQTGIYVSKSSNGFTIYSGSSGYYGKHSWIAIGL